MGKLKVAIGAAGLAASVVFLSNKENRSKLKSQVNQMMRKFDTKSNIGDIGQPTDIPDAKMVDEGAMTSVQYYNEWQEEKTN